MLTYNSPIDRIYQYLLISAFFLLPITVIGNNIAIWVTVLIWLFSGDYVKKFLQIKRNKFALSSILFFLIHLLGLFWTHDIHWGLEISRKMLPFLLVLPIFLTITKMQNIKLYILAFLVALVFSEILSYLIWLGIVEPFGSATLYNPTPLMSHISYNPFLALGIYLALYHLFSKKNISLLERVIYTFFALSMSFNMFITGGRAGQVIFFVFLALLAFQFFKQNQIKAVIISMFLSIFILTIAFNYSPIFKNRALTAINDVKVYDQFKLTSIGLRYTFFINSISIVKENPFFGVGTGDFPAEYSKASNILTPGVTLTVQPHNMYLLILVQLGFLGFASFMLMFYYQFQIAVRSNNQLIKDVGVAIPILFLVIMWSDSYLLGHFTGNLFVLFSSVIYGVQEKL